MAEWWDLKAENNQDFQDKSYDFTKKTDSTTSKAE